MFARVTCSLAALIIFALPAVAVADPVVFSAAGPSAASIQPAVDSFRTALGGINNGNNPGPLPTGRREINWDGGGATTATVSGTPFAGFQGIRGSLFTTPGSGFLQTPLTAPEFTGINPTYATTFNFFSPQRIFTALGSNIVDSTFTIPGFPELGATVSGFGVVFSDVDLANTTSLQFFNEGGASLGTYFAPTANNGFSFLAVYFNAGERVARVRITNGNSPLGPTDGGGVDVVVMDDFIYGEPQPIPEPTTMLLLGTGLAGVAAHARRRLRARRKSADA